MGKRLFSCGVFIDLKRFFDTVDHNTSALYKLEYHGFRCAIRRFFSSYLKGRAKTIQIGPHVSSRIDVTWGVTEGSVLQSWTKVLTQFRKTNAFEQRTEFCTGMKTSFSSVITPSPPANNVAKRFVDVYLFRTLKTWKGEASFHEGREQNLYQGKRLVIVSTTFVHDCRSFTVSFMG